MLPTSRPRTYVAASPVIASDLNDLFDAIVGFKHPELEFPHHISGWRQDGANATYNGLRWAANAGGDKLRTPIVAPVGTRITRARFGYHRGAAGLITYQLIRRDRGTAAADIVVASTIDGSTSGDTVAELAGINHTMLTGFDYTLAINFDASSGSNGALLYGGAHFCDRL
jgi:hypothetical protein